MAEDITKAGLARESYLEATARQRMAGFLDKDSFREIMPPTQKCVSPHLPLFDASVAFDDGVIIGEGLLDGRKVLVFAQEGGFRGGALGEVHSAKITGLLRRAQTTKPTAVLALVDSGGVRLEEANAGEIGASEIIRSILETRSQGIPVIALVGGTCGCFGGASLFTSCCDIRIASEEGRISVSGPAVIETVMGVEAFDSRDRALVWRTTGAKNRYLFSFVDQLVEDHLPAFRQAAIAALDTRRPTDEASLRQELAVLKERIARFENARDARDVWRAMGLPADDISAMDAERFTHDFGPRRPL